MTQTEITLKLRDDCIMILDAAKAWPVMEGHTWKEKQDAMAELMKSREDCEELIRRIDEVAMNDAATEIFSNEFIKGTAKLLQYRIDANDLSVGPAINRLKGTTTESTSTVSPTDAWQASIDAVIRAMNLIDQTVIGHKMLQELGDGDTNKIAALFEAKTGRPVKLKRVLMGPSELREKSSYMNHRIWLMEAALPVYVISYDKSQEQLDAEKAS